MITAAVSSRMLCSVPLISQPGYIGFVMCVEVGGAVLDLLNLEVAGNSPHTHVQKQICASMLNKHTSNDFHMVTFLTNTN